MSYKTDGNEEALAEMETLKPKLKKKGKKIIKFPGRERDGSGKYIKKVMHNESAKKTPAKSRKVSKDVSREVQLYLSRKVSKDHITSEKKHIKITSEKTDFLSIPLLKKEEEKKKILSTCLCPSCQADLTAQHRRGNESGYLPEVCENCRAPDQKAIAYNRELREAGRGEVSCAN